MANPANLFRPNGRLDELVLHVRPWSDDDLDKLGFDARSAGGPMGEVLMINGDQRAGLRDGFTGRVRLDARVPEMAV